jgi:hypothetical protein
MQPLAIFYPHHVSAAPPSHAVNPFRMHSFFTVQTYGKFSMRSFCVQMMASHHLLTRARTHTHTHTQNKNHNNSFYTVISTFVFLQMKRKPATNRTTARNAQMKLVLNLRPSLFWNVTQLVLAVAYRRSRTAYRPHLPMKMEPISWPETSEHDYQNMLRNAPEHRRPNHTAAKAWNVLNVSVKVILTRYSLFAYFQTVFSNCALAFQLCPVFQWPDISTYTNTMSSLYVLPASYGVCV